MTIPFESLAEQPDKQVTLIWDYPIRIAHWLLVASVAGAWVTSDSERLIVIHGALGYTLGLVLIFRIFWGLIGTKYARWSNFYPSPERVKRYLRSILRASPEHYVGHNPLGSVAIYMMLILLGSLIITGWIGLVLTPDGLITEAHEALANLLLVVIGGHVLGVFLSSLIHKENLIQSMIKGYKEESAAAGIRKSHAFAGGLLLVSATSSFIFLAFFSTH